MPLAEPGRDQTWAVCARHPKFLLTGRRGGIKSGGYVAGRGSSYGCQGPHVLDAVTLLDHLLHAMEKHQWKKVPMLRALHARDGPS